MKTFKDLGLSPEIIKSLDELGFIMPSPIQAKAIPFLLKSDQDLIALAQTGTGKTAAFALPILEKMKGERKELEAIILCPTRELCLQLHADIVRFSKHHGRANTVAVYGGESIDRQIRGLRSGANIVVGTPGRVLDLIRRKVLKLASVRWVVLDEADEMLDMGFKDDLDAILEETSATRQTLLFSATMSQSVRSIANNYMHDIHEISMGEKNKGADNVTHQYYVVNATDRFEALKRILDNLPDVYGILFCRTKIETQKVADLLKQAGYDAEAMHGDISQVTRTKIMDRFKKGYISLLVATDVAARGIDVSDLTHVINYNLPDQNEVYTHRSGRTGRAQKSGISLSIFTPREVRRVRELENIIGKTFEHKKVPSLTDVLNHQIDIFCEKIKEADDSKMISEAKMTEIEDRLKKLKKEELIRFLIIDRFGRILKDQARESDINASVKPQRDKIMSGQSANIRLGIGKKQGFTVKNLFAIFNSDKELKTVQIGRISLMPDYSVFGIEKDDLSAVLKRLKTLKFQGKKLDATESDDEPQSYQAKRKPYNKFSTKGGAKKYKSRY
jgi:ATP-dependent RNA helicase DeaD